MKTETTDPSRHPDDEFSYIDVSSVSNRTLEIEETQLVLGRDAPSRARKLVRTDDVLFATIRPTLRRIAVVPESLDGQVCSTGYFVLRAGSEVVPKFLFYFLQTECFMSSMAALQRGASYPAVSDGDIREQLLSLPPLPEQQRIVALLDAAFERIATAAANAERNLQNARDLFESHLAEVFSRRGDGWAERPLGELCEVLDSRRKPITKRDRLPGPIPYYGATGIQDYVDDFIFDEPLVLVGEDGAKWGSGDRTAFAVCGKCWVNNHAHVLRPHRDQICDYWLIAYLLHLDLSPFVSGLTVPKLTQARLREIPIPVPPLAEQMEIARSAERMDGQSQRLVQIYEQKQATLAALKRSLLQQAFDGEL